MSDQKANLLWLAGFMDGEGYIGIYGRPDKKTYNYVPCVQIPNTNDTAISEVRRILESLGIAYYVRGEKPRSSNHKALTRVEAHGIHRTLKFLWVIEPYLVVKQPQAQFVMAWIWSRLKQEKGNNPYSEEELNIYRAVKEMNVRGTVILNEYTQRATPFVAMMYSELRAKGAEVTETMTRSNNGVTK